MAFSNSVAIKQFVNQINVKTLFFLSVKRFRLITILKKESKTNKNLIFFFWFFF